MSNLLKNMVFYFIKNYNYLLAFFILFINFSKSETVTVSGMIMDTTNSPIKKAEIILKNLRGVVLAEEETDRKGVFKIKDIEPDYYYLIIKYQQEIFEKNGGVSYKQIIERVKLNPGSKKKNKSININITLPVQKKSYLVFSFSGAGPIIDHDPVLNLNPPLFESSPEFISISWEDIKFSKQYIVFENGIEVQRDSLNRFESTVFPGKEFCYSIQAIDDFGFRGLLTTPVCGSAPTVKPRDIQIKVSKNTLVLNWSNVKGAEYYNVYREGKRIGAGIDTIAFKDPNLEFKTDYIYSITAIDSLDNESQKSIEIKGTTHEYVAPPILSSVKDETKLVLIWNKVDLAKSYNLYRNDTLIINEQSTSYSETKPPGEKFCYLIRSVDQYGEESESSNIHCAKVEVKPPDNFIADGGIKTIYLNWDKVNGAVGYNVYGITEQDSANFLKNVPINHYKIENLPYSKEFCYRIASVDADGDKSIFSDVKCAKVFSSPNFSIKKFSLIEPSGNNAIDAREKGDLRFAIHNDGQSPAFNVIVKVSATSDSGNFFMQDSVVIDTVFPDKIKYADFEIEGYLTIKTSEVPIEVILNCREGFKLNEPFNTTFETKAVIPPEIIISDFAISNSFNTQYIPQNEEATLSLRLQNIGEGITEFVKLEIPDSNTFSTPNFSSPITTPGIVPGDYFDVEIPIQSKESSFTIDFQLTDYLGIKKSNPIIFEILHHYKHPEDMVLNEIGEDSLGYLKKDNQDIDVDIDIPFGRKNYNTIAVVMATEQYEDGNYLDLKFANRDGHTMRNYFQNSFGLSDFQILPSKPWQMEGGPSLNDLVNTFDPYQGILRERVVNAGKYSGIDEVSIIVYIRSLGEWVDGQPYIIPKDANFSRYVTKYSLDQFAKDISLLSVITTIKSITVFLDITYINPEKSNQSQWNFSDLNEKICILSASSNGETSQTYPLKKHSLFLYSLLKGFAGGADDGDAVIELGEITDYVYKTVPKEVKGIPNSKGQNPSLYGLDLKRTILDLR